MVQAAAECHAAVGMGGDLAAISLVAGVNTPTFFKIFYFKSENMGLISKLLIDPLCTRSG